MPIIKLTTEIESTIEICFDLSRSIDLHTISTAKTNEKAIEGVISGLIGLNEVVTWQATHFGVKQELTSKITDYNRPTYFRDEQLKGIFKSIYHEHIFEDLGNKVLMTDVFKFETPFSVLGKFFNQMILTNYLRQFLIERNKIIKDYAETDKWKQILTSNI